MRGVKYCFENRKNEKHYILREKLQKFLFIFKLFFFNNKNLKNGLSKI